MRQVKNVLLALFTLALVAAGAAMPFAASRVQDARQTGAEVRSFASFMLTLEKKSELSRILRFFTENSYRYASIETDPVRKPRLSEAEALDAAREAVVLLSRYGIVSQAQMEAAIDNEVSEADKPNVSPLLMFSTTDEQLSPYIVWIVDWVNLNIGIYLDDASGKAYYIGASNFWVFDGEWYDSNTASTGRSRVSLEEDFYNQLENWCLFLEEYYEVQIINIEESPVTYTYSKSFRLYIDLEDGGDWLPMQVYLHDDFSVLGVGSVE